MGRGVTQWARQSSEFAPEIGGTEIVSPTPSPVHRETDGESSWNHTAATFRPIAPKAARFRQSGIGGPIAFQLPSVLGKAA